MECCKKNRPLGLENCYVGVVCESVIDIGTIRVQLERERGDGLGHLTDQKGPNEVGEDGFWIYQDDIVCDDYAIVISMAYCLSLVGSI